MVDVNTIKPGQRLRYIGEDSKHPSEDVWLRKGELYEVVASEFDSTFAASSGCTFVKVLVPGSFGVFSDATCFDCADLQITPTPKPCGCNLWFGCKCGAFEREKESVR